MAGISKRDLFSMSRDQVAAGQRFWERTGQSGRLSRSSFDSEAMAPKTWILFADSKGAEIATIECELYTVPRRSDAAEGVVMLIGMCPKCHHHFLAREDNKTMFVEYVEYRRAPAFLKVNWRWHCENVLGRQVRDADKIPVVSSPERWACDYCHEWCVKVDGGIAKMDLTGVTQLTVHGRPHLIDKSNVEF